MSDMEKQAGEARDAAFCEYCGPVCYRGASHNARVEFGDKWGTFPGESAAVPAVPAQPADLPLPKPTRDELAEGHRIKAHWAGTKGGECNAYHIADLLARERELREARDEIAQLRAALAAKAAPQVETEVSPSGLVTERINAAEAARRLREIHKEVQCKINDQWDWMDADFYVEMLLSMAQREEAAKSAPGGDEREAFWRWAIQWHSEWFNAHGHINVIHEADADRAWEAWQARATLATVTGDPNETH